MIKRVWLCPFFVLLFFLASCDSNHVTERQSFVFGTLVEVIVSNATKEQANWAIDEVMHDFDRLNRQFHPWEKPSELVSLNEHIAAGKPFKASSDMVFMIKDMQYYEKLTKGLFNTAIGLLIDLWGFHSSSFVPCVPSAKSIRFLLSKKPSLGDLSIDDRGYIRSSNRFVSLDDGGYAKGLALDRAIDIMKHHNIKNALINIGGNVIAIGKNNGNNWLIGIRDPRLARAFAIIPLRDGESIGTSGNYHRYFDYKGVRYCHIINPFLGYPPLGVESVTVLIERRTHSGVRSDVLSKPLFLSDSSSWIELAKSLDVKLAARVFEGKYEMTSSLAKRAVFIDPKITIVKLF